MIRTDSDRASTTGHGTFVGGRSVLPRGALSSPCRGPSEVWRFLGGFLWAKPPRHTTVIRAYRCYHRCYSRTAKIGSLGSILVVSFALILIGFPQAGRRAPHRRVRTQIVTRSLPHTSLSYQTLEIRGPGTHPIDPTDAGARLQHLSLKPSNSISSISTSPVTNGQAHASLEGHPRVCAERER
jgi:hypothetical protein